MFSFNNQSEFSNYYICKIQYNNLVYTSSEAIYQSMKYNDIKIRQLFCTFTPDEARHYAHTHLTGIRPDWDYIKDSVMYDIVTKKFEQHPELAKLLLATGRHKIEENTTAWHDNYWGHCYCAECKKKEHYNKLGLVLMKVRSDLRAKKRG